MKFELKQSGRISVEMSPFEAIRVSQLLRFGFSNPALPDFLKSTEANILEENLNNLEKIGYQNENNL